MYYNMIKILVSAYLNSNLGDDLFVYYLVKRYPQCIFYFDPEFNKRLAFLKDLNNVKYSSNVRKIVRKIFNKISKKYLMCFIKQVDALVKIGGSIFIEYDGWEENWPQNENKPFFVLGTNFGPYENDSFKSLVEKKLRQTCDCCFRDNKSYQLFSHLSNVRVASDILFGFKEYLNNKKKSKRIGINLISLENRKELSKYSKKYYEGIARLSDLLQKKGFEVCLVGFCVNEGDKDAINIVSKLARIEVKSIIYDGELFEFLEAFQEFEYIVATRLHAMVLGWSMGKKVFPLVYSNKQINIMSDISESIKYKNIIEFCEEDAETIACIIENISVLDVEKEKNNSNSQFLWLDKFVNSHS